MPGMPDKPNTSDPGDRDALRDDILRVITRVPMHPGQHLLYKLLLEAPDDGWLDYGEFAETIFDGDRKQLSGLLAALSRRINNTRRATSSHLSELVLETRRKQDWQYRARPALRAAIEALPALAARLREPTEELKRSGWTAVYRTTTPLPPVPPSPRPTDSAGSIADQFDAFQSLGAEEWTEWRARCLHVVRRFTNIDEATFRAPETQEELWRARALAGVGSGEAVGTEALYDDGPTIDAWLEARRVGADASLESMARAARLQRIYDSICTRAADRCRAMPKAKVTRAFAVLLPAHVHCAIQSEANRHVASRFGIDLRSTGPVERTVLVMHRLRTVLGATDDLEELVLRSQFCWWLYPIYSPPMPTAPGDAPPATPMYVRQSDSGS